MIPAAPSAVRASGISRVRMLTAVVVEPFGVLLAGCIFCGRYRGSDSHPLRELAIHFPAERQGDARSCPPPGVQVSG